MCKHNSEKHLAEADLHLNKDPQTPVHQKQNSEKSSDIATQTGSMEKSAMQVDQQIEEHSLSAKDHERRAHILYNLPSLESLPRRSSSSISYLNASQRKMRQRNGNNLTGEDDEIQSRLRTTEERIASVSIFLHDKFQILQRGTGGRIR